MASITFKELREMTPEQRDRALADLVEAARRPPTNGALDRLNAEIARFEEKYGFDSKEVRRRVSEGIQKETDEVLEWLMLLNRRDRVASFAS